MYLCISESDCLTSFHWLLFPWLLFHKPRSIQATSTQGYQAWLRIRSDWLQMGPIWDFMSLVPKWTENWSEKVPDLARFVPIWLNLRPNLTRLVVIIKGRNSSYLLPRLTELRPLTRPANKSQHLKSGCQIEFIFVWSELLIINVPLISRMTQKYKQSSPLTILKY